MSIVLQALFDGILIGGVYATIGLGLSLSYGVMNIINWSAGETLMVGLYLSWAMITFLGFDPYLTIIPVMIIMTICGYALQRTVFNNMIVKGKAQYRINILLFTSGLGISLASLAEILLGAQPVTAKTVYTGKTLVISDIFLSIPKLVSFGIAVIATVGLFLFIQHSETGRAIRAISQDRTAAQLMGINANKVYCIALAISYVAIGISAALLIPYYPVQPSVGETFSFKALIVVVLGGKGNILGALVGGLVVGVVEKLGAFLWSDAYSQGLIFLLFIVILLVRPEGLLSFNIHAKKMAKEVQ